MEHRAHRRAAQRGELHAEAVEPKVRTIAKDALKDEGNRSRIALALADPRAAQKRCSRQLRASARASLRVLASPIHSPQKRAT